METHGTGTPLGDPVEIAGLTQAFGDGARETPCYLGSVKSNIGHLEAAAGVAGLIKLLLALRHKRLPGHPTLTTLNRQIRVGDRFEVLTDTIDWPAPKSGRRLAGLSSFGFGGANVHAVIEEAPEREAAVRAARPLSVFNRTRFWAEAAHLPDALRTQALPAAATPSDRQPANLTGMLFETTWRPATPEIAPATGAALILDAGGRSAAALGDRLGARIITASDLTGTATDRALIGEAPAFVLFVADARSFAARAPDAVVAAREQGPLALVRLVRALHRADSLHLGVLTSGGTAPTGEDSPTAAALIALTRTIAHEYPRWSVSAIDIDRKTPVRAVTQTVLPALLSPGGDVLAHAHGSFFARSLTPVDAGEAASPFNAKGAVHVIIGGRGGIGGALALDLARRGKARLALIGRCAAENDTETLLGEIRAAGGEALYVRADATDAEALEQALSEVVARWGGIDTIVNAAMVLDNHRLNEMSDAAFRSAYDAKAQIASALEQAMTAQGLNCTVVHMSSVQSLAGNPGQGNYAAGCGFLDCWAAGSPIPTKLISWGYWGEIGAVSGEAWAKAMAVQGIGSIRLDEGLAALDALLSGEHGTLTLAKGTPEALAKLGIGGTSVVTDDMPAIAATDPMQHALPLLEQATAAKTRAVLLTAAGADAPAFDQTDAWAARLSVTPANRRLLEALLSVATQADASDSADLDALKRAHPVVGAHVTLLRRVFDALPDLLAGRIDGPSVILPDGTLDLVEPIYTGNPMVDAANAQMAKIISRIANDGDAGAVLEIGAGTGATSRFILNALAQTDHPAEYWYTDVSPVFTRHGWRLLAGNYPRARFEPLDIEADPLAQGFEAGGYDVVLASNVLHATADISTTLKHIAMLLKPGGRLLLGELTQVLHVNTVIFGLLPGWWNASDGRRLPHAPLLSLDEWHKALGEAGFAVDPVWQDAFGLSVICATLRKRSGSVDIRYSQPVDREPAKPAAAASGPLATEIARHLAEVLRLDAGTIDADAPFIDLGLDSILAGELARKLSDALALDIKPTEFFNHPTVARLARNLAQRGAAADKPAEPQATSTDDDALLLDLLGDLESGKSDAETVRKALQDGPGGTPQPGTPNSREDRHG
ncbi:SDR family NAD(P)-dependent oxidoreductase [Breoghania sp. L-A4]|nr:SDR family NAD(P)-dependent oxidoreductase [Breoghania sp. L-A4]